MAKPTVSYITNTIIRFILTALGKQLNYKAFSKKKHWKEILHYFNRQCCYCGKVDKKGDKLEVDHIIGINKAELGFDCLGNVAPACGSCNRKKNNLGRNGQVDRYGWEIHLASVCNNKKLLEKRKKLIQSYLKQHNYPHPIFDIGSKQHKQVVGKVGKLSRELDDLLSTKQRDFDMYLKKLLTGNKVRRFS